MVETLPETKDRLLAEIDRTWKSLNDALARLTDAQMTEPRDAVGWNAKDHVTHLIGWLRSVIYLLHRKPRHEGLGVEEAAYLSHDYDRINASVQRQYAHLTPGEAIAQLRDVHRQLMALIEPMSYDDLMAPYGLYLPDEPRDDNTFPILRVICGDTIWHFPEHQEYLEAIVNSGK